jgi:hypothetical protein
MRKQQLSYRSILEPKLLLFCAGTADTNPETELLLCSVQELSVLIFSTTQEDKTTDIMSGAFKIEISSPILLLATHFLRSKFSSLAEAQMSASKSNSRQARRSPKMVQTRR